MIALTKVYHNLINDYAYINANSSIFCISIKSIQVPTKITKFKFNTSKSILTMPGCATNSLINLNNNGSLNLQNWTLSKNLDTGTMMAKAKWHFLKIKYHGKGYKIKKYNSISKLTFRFGRSHWAKIFFRKSIYNIRRTKKNTYTILSWRLINKNPWQRAVLKIKGVNRYTKRGVRLTRTKLKRRFGKVSQASSVYK